MKSLSAENRSTRGAKRARVLEEAAKALNSRGVSQTSLSEIARGVGVSRAALYYYFEDQQDLVFQSYRRSCEIMARRLCEATHQGGDAMAVIEAFVDGMLGEDEAEFAALSEAAFLRPEQRNTILGLYAAIMTSIADILQTGARRGELRACSTVVIAQAIIGLVSWVPMARRWRTSDPLSHQDLVDAIKSILVAGIAADRAAPSTYRHFDLSPGDLPIDRVFDPEVVAAAKQEALLASASWLFNLKGVDATSLEEIAVRLGVTKKVIYHNVGDKQDLVVACYRRSFRIYAHIGERVGHYKGSRIEAICAASHANAEAGLREDLAPLAPLGGFDALPGPARDEIQAAAVRLMDGYLEAYAQGQAEGTIRPLHARAILAVNAGMFEWLPKWIDTFQPDERELAPGELANLMRLGLKPVSSR